MHEQQNKIKIETEQKLSSPFALKYGLTILLLLAAGFTILFAPQAIRKLQSGISGNVLRVPGDYPTIQEAINAARPGDTVQVRAGTYKESLTINKEIALVAQAFDQADPTKNTTTIDGSGQENTILISTG